MHLSAGELLRNARNSGSPDGQLIADYIKEGKIVPVEITIKLLMDVSNVVVSSQRSIHVPSTVSVESAQRVWP